MLANVARGSSGRVVDCATPSAAGVKAQHATAPIIITKLPPSSHAESELERHKTGPRSRPRAHQLPPQPADNPRQRVGLRLSRPAQGEPSSPAARRTTVSLERTQQQRAADTSAGSTAKRVPRESNGPVPPRQSRGRRPSLPTQSRDSARLQTGPAIGGERVSHWVGPHERFGLPVGPKRTSATATIRSCGVITNSLSADDRIRLAAGTRRSHWGASRLTEASLHPAGHCVQSVMSAGF
jgi:hypothetical protein